jgi:rhomboid family GlyGly-CTERM serine protease
VLALRLSSMLCPRWSGFASALGRVPWITVAIACIAILIPGRFEYDRAAILRGEVWRLVTGHLTHWSPDHLLWDVVAFVALGIVCERRHGLFGVTLLASAVAVSLFLLIACPEIASYRGLSAVDSTLWIWAALRVRDQSRTYALLLNSVFAAKVMLEAAAGSPLFVAQTNDILILPVVHLLGAAIGFTAGVIYRRCEHHDLLHASATDHHLRRRRDEPAVVGRVA